MINEDKINVVAACLSSLSYLLSAEEQCRQTIAWAENMPIRLVRCSGEALFGISCREWRREKGAFLGLKRTKVKRLPLLNYSTCLITVHWRVNGAWKNFVFIILVFFIQESTISVVEFLRFLFPCQKRWNCPLTEDSLTRHSLFVVQTYLQVVLMLINADSYECWLITLSSHMELFWMTDSWCVNREDYHIYHNTKFSWRSNSFKTCSDCDATTVVSKQPSRLLSFSWRQLIIFMAIAQWKAEDQGLHFKFILRRTSHLYPADISRKAWYLDLHEKNFVEG